jgi:nucleoside phosphorylase
MNQEETKQGPIDFALVTALQIERDAVRCRLDHHEIIQDDSDPHSYYYGHLDIPGTGERYSVVAVMCLGMGNDEAVATTMRVIQRWQPENIIMVGIAGGVTGKVALGDVVVAELCHYYEFGKRTPNGERRRPQQFISHRILLGRAQAYEAPSWREDIRVERPSGGTGTQQPQVHFGAIASGEKVIADEKTLNSLLRENDKILAVAMEGAGVARAVAHQDPTPRFLEIRGVSDFADHTKKDDWQLYAADAAAAFTVGLLRSRPIRPSAKDKFRTQTETPVLVICAKSLRPIAEREVLKAFGGRFQGRKIETVALDFTDLVTPDDTLIDPEVAAQRIADPQGKLFAALARFSESELVFHGLAHIPLVVLAGHLITDRQHVQLFDFHSNTWAWPETSDQSPPLNVHGLPTKRLRSTRDVVVRFSASYMVTGRQIRAIVSNPAVEVDLTVPEPERGVVRSEEQVRKYGKEFRHVIDLIARQVPACRCVHLFYAGPVALAFHLGQQISATIHPPVIVWNFRRGNYEWGIDLSAAVRGDGCIVRFKQGEDVYVNKGEV